MTKVTLIAASQLLLSILLWGGVWVALPARWLWVDAPSTIVALSAAAAGAGLLLRAAWATRFVRWLLWLELGCGCACVSLLGLSAAQLLGSYGPVGSGGAVLMGAIALLILPYLVCFPALQLGWLRELS
jgi:hypothetical protein